MKMLLLGDICPTNSTASLFKEEKTNRLFTDTLSLFKNKDFIFANLECALTDSDNAINKFGPALKAPSETAKVLKEIGIDCCGLSNNHIFDFGIQGVKDTFKALDAAGVSYTGFGDNYEASRKDYIIRKNNEKICIITVCEHEYSYALDDRMGSRPYDEYDTMEDIRNAKKDADKVIVIYHGGKEFCKYPSPRLYRLCHAMAKNGADVVLCQHSHCIGSYEQFEGCHILYGQGNFHFVKPHSFEGWFSGFAVVYDTLSKEIEFIPIKSEEYGISLAQGDDKETIMSEFFKRNEMLLNGEWKQGWHDFCVEMKDVYLNAITNAFDETQHKWQNGIFSHFLNCEAHTDVWRELFPSYNLSNEKF